MKTKKHVSAWFNTDYYDEGFELLAKNADVVDDISIGWTDYYGRDRKKEKDLLELCKSNNIRPLTLVGAFYQDIERHIGMIKNTPKELAEHFVNETETSGVAGVDVDYEGFPGDVRNAYTDFMFLLTEKMHSAGKTVSICVGPLEERVAEYHRRNNHVPFVDAEKVGFVVDQFRILCYDMYVPPSAFIGPTATLPWVRDVFSYFCKLVPKEKIIAGLSIHSIDWNMTDPKKSGALYDNDRLVELSKKSICGMGYVMYYDVYYLRYVDDEGATHLVWVNNAETFSYLLDVVGDIGVGGISVWELLGGDPEVWNQIREKFGTKL